MWKGSISFGLVTIPVKLYAATESKDVRFHLLHAACHTPIQYRKWCQTCEQEVSQEALVRGYEYDREQYVVVADADVEAIPIAAAHTLEIVSFVRLEQIDPIYFDKPYFLEPGDGGAKAYSLLKKAMELTGRIAVARVVIRSRETLAAIRVYGEGVLAMETMRFPDEVRSAAGLATEEPNLRPQEVEMATSLISRLSSDFVPDQYQNEYRQSLLELIQARVAGQEVVRGEQPPQRGKVVDLMEALRASIRKAEDQRTAESESAAVATAMQPWNPGTIQPGPGAMPPGPGAVPPGQGIPGTPFSAPPLPAMPMQPAPGMPGPGPR